MVRHFWLILVVGWGFISIIICSYASMNMVRDIVTQLSPTWNKNFKALLCLVDNRRFTLASILLMSKINAYQRSNLEHPNLQETIMFTWIKVHVYKKSTNTLVQGCICTYVSGTYSISQIHMLKIDTFAVNMVASSKSIDNEKMITVYRKQFQLTQTYIICMLNFSKVSYW